MMRRFGALFVILSVAGTALAEKNTDSETGLIIARGYRTVKKNCTACHGARLTIQNGATRDGWLATIRWMQATQNLWKFSRKDENVILDYLAKYYAPKKTGRRLPLEVSEWYLLEKTE